MKRFDAKTANTIIIYLRGGAFIETAAAGAAISKVTLYDWLRRGKRRGRGPMFEFAEQVEQAMALFELEAINGIGEAARGEKIGEAPPGGKQKRRAGQWQAWAWLMERKYPDRYGRRDHVEHTGTTSISTAFRGAARAKLEGMDSGDVGEAPPEEP